MISIIVPIYNVEPYLRCCIDSVISQTYTDIEILLIDDGSPDNCGEICDEYANKDERIRVFHTDNHGLSAARNIGIKEATGQFIGFVDSDDWIEPNMYEVLLKKAHESNADVCECNFWFGTSEKDYANMLDATYKGSESLEALFKNNICHVVWNKIYKKQLFDSVCFPEGRNIEDISIMHLLLNQADIVSVTSEKMYHYRQREGSIRSTYSASNLIDYANAFLDRYKFYKQNETVLHTINCDEQLCSATLGISRVWRWWYGCDKTDKLKYSNKLVELKQFTNEHIPLFGCSSWPLYLRCSSFFMHSNSTASLMVLYYFNQLYRKINPAKSSVIE